MRYLIAIDRGGTFTDGVLIDRISGQRRVAKVPSSEASPLAAIRELLALGPGEPIPPSEIRLGTTVATNALLERSGARTGLLITRGFKDLLKIGTQARPELFDLAIKKPEVLFETVEEVDARLSSDGTLLSRPQIQDVRLALERLKNAGMESVAIVVLHAYLDDSLELELADLATRAGFSSVITSAAAAREIGLLGRTTTAVLDAYVAPLLFRHLEVLRNELPGSEVWFMQSAGGLARPELLRGPQALLSGPAGGAVAAAKIAKSIGAEKLIALDMGGTSTDVTWIEGSPSLRKETLVDSIPVFAPMVDILTVAAGGGSVCTFDGASLSVGPSSVGAVPGPLCYGHKDATALSLTDINWFLGRLSQDHFPFSIDGSRGSINLSALAAKISAQTQSQLTPSELALGFVEVANTHMAEAIRRVSIKRGRDPESAKLLIFGGAGGQHACGIARALNIKEVLVHRLSGVLSAYGISMAERLATVECDAGRVLLSDELSNAQLNAFRDIEHEALSALGVAAGDCLIERLVELRYRGTETRITVSLGPSAAMRASFDALHEERFGFFRADAALEICALRIDARSGHEPVQPTPQVEARGTRPTPIRLQSVTLPSGSKDVPVFELAALVGCAELTGPALLLDPTGTIFLEPGFSAILHGDLLSMKQLNPARGASDTAALSLDVARLEIISQRASSIAEQMGDVLQRSASSTNIRDRLDFSCAVFDSKGQLIANAPHIPVHLGAMGQSVRAVINRFPAPPPGSAYATNDPSLGGSHLPDITVVSPVHEPNGRLRFYVASRGHHADVGGITPGSMPATSTTLLDEGVVLSCVPLVQNGQFLESDLRRRLLAGPHPARNPDENLADLRAQLAANVLGARQLLALQDAYSPEVIEAYFSHLLDAGEIRTRLAIKQLPDGVHRYVDHLDDGEAIQVAITVTGEEMSIDFSGTSPQVSGNLNAPRAVTIAAVLYFLRSMIGEPLPLNDGCLRPVSLHIPENSLVSPGPNAAVAGGNVETSMRICDVLFGAVGLCAASQGTMNNVSFGAETFGYYETLAGGAGAGPGFRGAHAVHSHMTNTRITDPEILESRFPIRLWEFSIRAGSGGPGAYPGGDGLKRTFETLQPLTLSLLTQRRTSAPFGLAGGEAGQPGANWVNGAAAPSLHSQALAARSIVTIETPGGGGYGPRATAP